MRKRWSFLLLTTAVLFGGSVPAAFPADKVAEWPQFRGPNRDDLSADKGLLKTWPKDGPPLLWTATGVGGGYASVAIAGGKLFTLGNKKDTTFLVALNLADGKLLWSAEVGKAGGNLGCTPTVDGDLVYAIGQSGDLVCVDARTGQLNWRTNFMKDFGGKCGGWNYTESPLVDGDQLVCTPGSADAAMVALNKKNGEVIWKCPSPFENTKAGYASIVVAEVGGLRHYVQLTAGGVLGVDAKTGKLLWRYGDTNERFANTTANIPTCIVKGDLVFVCAGYNRGGALLKLTRSGDGIDVSEVYYNRALKNKHGGVVLVGDYLYADRDDSGNPYCADFKTGAVVPGWKDRSQASGSGSAAVTYADGHLYWRYQSSVMVLAEATPEGYKEKGSFKIPKASGNSWAHPVVVGGRLYLRQQDVVHCYDVKR